MSDNTLQGLAHVVQLDASSAQGRKLIARHPDVFSQSPWSRYRSAVILAAVVAYLSFSTWFFQIPQKLGGANWGIAGSYLADWVSYESRPDIEYHKDGSVDVGFPRFDPEGPDAIGSWISVDGSAESSRLVAVRMGAAGRVTITPDQVLLERNGESLALRVILDDRVELSGSGQLPSWASQKREGGKVVASFGLAGRVEVDDDEVKVRKRFAGWENFLFDTQSAFRDRALIDIAALLLSSERLEPERSNLSLAWHDILYNADWQHLDVWTKLLQTIVMAFVGTLLAVLLGFSLAFLAARNITRNRGINQITKRSFDFLRSVDMLIWALFFTRAFGPGPLAGIAAIFFTETGTLGKLYAEALENIDNKQSEGVTSTGARQVLVQRFGVLPQVLPVFASQALYFWESNTRSATIIGAVGAGGIGLKLWEAMRTNSDWENVFYMVILILLVVYLFDTVSNALRKRLSGVTDEKH